MLTITTGTLNMNIFPHQVWWTAIHRSTLLWNWSWRNGASRISCIPKICRLFDATWPRSRPTRRKSAIRRLSAFSSLITFIFFKLAQKSCKSESSGVASFTWWLYHVIISQISFCVSDVCFCHVSMKYFMNNSISLWGTAYGKNSLSETV